MRICDLSSDVCSSDLLLRHVTKFRIGIERLEELLTLLACGGRVGEMAEFRGEGSQILGLLCYPLFRCCNRRLALIVGHALDGASGLTGFDGGELAGA